MTEDSATKAIRPTKKQQDILVFIETFIAENGYSPSYREIMNGLNYTSVATVSLHINSLIRRGHLAKRDHSARSLEVIKPDIKVEAKIVPKQLKTSEAKWLVEKVEVFFKELEASASVDSRELDKLYVLVGALKVLGQDGAAASFMPRLAELKDKIGAGEYSV